MIENSIKWAENCLSNPENSLGGSENTFVVPREILRELLEYASLAARPIRTGPGYVLEVLMARESVRMEIKDSYSLAQAVGRMSQMPGFRGVTIVTM